MRAFFQWATSNNLKLTPVRPNSMTLNLPSELSTNDLVAMLPEGSAPIDARSAQGRRLRRTIQKGLAHLVLRDTVKLLRHAEKERRDKLDKYETSYDVDARNAANNYDKIGRKDLFRLGDDFIVELEGRQFLRLMTERLGDILEKLEPESLCEVGAGMGRNLLSLASRFPTVRCAAFELSSSGVATAKALQSLPDLPDTSYGRFYNIDPTHMDNVRRIDFQQGSAYNLPAADNSYDVVYTFAALEQMHDGIDAAMSELRRIARRYVLLFEPFTDCNDLLGRAYLRARNYFRMPIVDLPAYGFEIVRTWRVVPVKPTFAYGFVLLRPL